MRPTWHHTTTALADRERELGTPLAVKPVSKLTHLLSKLPSHGR